MTTWPATLPVPLIAGFSEALPNNMLRTSMDAGPAKVRRRTTANVGQLTVPLLLTSAQVDTLVGFFKEDTANGALAFDFTHPRTSNTISCRFTAPFDISSPDGINYPITLQLEVMP